MIVFRIKYAIIAAILLSISAGCAKDDSRESAVRAVSITLAEGTMQNFFDEMRGFANRNNFAIRIVPTRPDVPHFSINLWRADIKAGGANPFDDLTFQIGFYENDDQLPDPAVYDEILSSLKQMVGRLPGAAVTIIK